VEITDAVSAMNFTAPLSVVTDAIFCNGDCRFHISNGNDRCMICNDNYYYKDLQWRAQTSHLHSTSIHKPHICNMNYRLALNTFRWYSFLRR
jgi:hypothetical protein